MGRSRHSHVVDRPGDLLLFGRPELVLLRRRELNYWWREPTWWRESTIALLGRVGLIAAVMSATVLVTACVRGQLQRRTALGIVALGAIGFVAAASYREATAGGIGALIGIQLVPIIAVVVVFGLVVAAYRLMSGDCLRPTSNGRDHAPE